MPTVRLDLGILKKLAKRKRRDIQSIRESVAHKASRDGIASEAVLVLMANREGIGSASYLRRLAPHIQDQVRSSSREGGSTTSFARAVQKSVNTKRRPQEEQVLAAATAILLRDKQLQDRCKDLLKAPRNYDRVFREATTVLEHRIRKTAGIREKMTGAPLVGKAISPDPSRAILEVSADRNLQEGFHNLCRGSVLWVRNATHHELIDELTRVDALQFCGFIDSLLSVIGRAQVHLERR